MLDKHRPRMCNERADKLRSWQDALYKGLLKQRTTKVEFFGRSFVVPPSVHMINPMSDLIGNSILESVKFEDRVLDMGTGCGVNAILAASISDNVVAVDVNPVAVDAAKANARLNNVENRISFCVSNLFENVDGRFDTIIFDPPFRWFKPRGICEVATTDENYKTLREFFKKVKHYLAQKGKLLICFGSSGDIEYLFELINEMELEKEIIAHRSLKKDGLYVDYYTFLIVARE